MIEIGSDVMGCEPNDNRLGIINQTTRMIVVIISLAIAVILCLDYFNIPARIGLNASNFNSMLVSFFLNSMTAFMIFSLTYFFVERWNVNNRKNKREVALLLIKKTYQNCINDLEILHGFATPILVKKQTLISCTTRMHLQINMRR